MRISELIGQLLGIMSSDGDLQVDAMLEGDKWDHDLRVKVHFVNAEKDALKVVFEVFD